MSSLSNTVQEQANLVRQFKQLAEALDIHLILIAQPKKTKATLRTADDLSGSAILRAEADHIITLSRKRRTDSEDDSSFEPQTIVRVDMTRWSTGGSRLLYFNGPTQKFTELETRYESDGPSNDLQQAQ